MGKGPIIVLCASAAFILISVKIEARRKHTIDEYLFEDQRTHTRKQNYILQRALEDDLNVLDGELDSNTAYTVDDKPEKQSEDLPGLIVDYANMIKNDVVLLDNTVETRTRKRGNIKVKKINNNWKFKTLGEGYYPSQIETKICNMTSCAPRYTCQQNIYEVTVLKWRTEIDETSMDNNLHNKLRRNWIAEIIPVVVGCTCVHEDML